MNPAPYRQQPIVFLQQYGTSNLFFSGLFFCGFLMFKYQYLFSNVVITSQHRVQTSSIILFLVGPPQAPDQFSPQLFTIHSVQRLNYVPVAGKCCILI